MEIIKSNYWIEGSITKNPAWQADQVMYKASKSKLNPFPVADKVSYQGLKEVTLITSENYAELVKRSELCNDNDVVLLQPKVTNLKDGKFAAYIEFTENRKAIVLAKEADIEKLTKHLEANKAGKPVRNGIPLWQLVVGGLVIWLIYSMYSVPMPSTNASSNNSKDKASVLIACQKLIRAQSKYPSKVDFPWMTGHTIIEKGYGYIVNGKADAMNGLGNMMPIRYKCVYETAGNKFTQAYIVD